MIPTVPRVALLMLGFALLLPAAAGAQSTGSYGYGGYYGGYYDPYDPERSYPDPAIPPKVYEEGKLSIKVKPRQAEVFMNGNLIGRVDDFDGRSQELRMEAGTHRLEVRQPGYQTLTFTVRIQPKKTTTYRGSLKKAP